MTYIEIESFTRKGKPKADIDYTPLDLVMPFRSLHPRRPSRIIRWLSS